MRNLVQSAKTLVLLGVITAAIVACGRELAAPDQPDVDTGSRPEALALVAQNRYACSIVVWSGDTTHARKSLRFRKTLPASAAAAPDSGSLARYGFMRFNRASGALQVDVVCVLPQSDQARQDAAAYFRKYDPLASNETLNAARQAGLLFSWGDGGDVWCSADEYTLYCEGGVTCAMMARSPANAPSYSRRAATQSRSNNMMAVCDNGCDVYDFNYYCGGGDGTVDYGGGGGGSGCGTEQDSLAYEYHGGPNDPDNFEPGPECTDFVSSYSSTYFSWSKLNGDWAGGNESRHSPYGLISPNLVTNLDAGRAQFGSPIYLSSGYRCPNGNAAVGGVQGSHHMQGKAADMYSTSNHQWTEAQFQALRDIFDNLGATTLPYTQYQDHHLHVQY